MSQIKKRPSNITHAAYFVLKTSYWGGFATRLTALYASYILLGMTPFGMIYAWKYFYDTLASQHISSFLQATAILVLLRVGIKATESFLKYLSRQASRIQNWQIQNMALRTSKLGLQSNTMSTDAKFKGSIGQRLVSDSEKLFFSVNKLIEISLQSLTTIAVNLFFLLSIGMYGSAVAITGTTLLINFIALEFTTRFIAPLDSKSNLQRDELRNRHVQAECAESYQKDNAHKNLESTLADYQKTQQKQFNYDFLLDGLNSVIRDAAFPLGGLIVVLVLTRQFPVTSNFLPNGQPLTVALAIQACQAIFQVIINISILLKNYQAVYQATSSYNNLTTFFNNKSLSPQHQVLSYRGSTRRNLAIDHITYHCLCALSGWSLVTGLTQLYMIAIGSQVASLPLLLATSLFGIVSSTLAQSKYSKAHDDIYDYIFNLISASIGLAVGSIIIFSMPTASLWTFTYLPTWTQKVNASLVVFSILYSASSVIGSYLKPSENQKNQIHKSYIQHKPSTLFSTKNNKSDLIDNLSNENLVDTNSSESNKQPQRNLPAL